MTWTTNRFGEQWSGDYRITRQQLFGCNERHYLWHHHRLLRSYATEAEAKAAAEPKEPSPELRDGIDG